MWKNIVEPGRPQMTIWRMRIAFWIPKATRAPARASTHTQTHTQYVILLFYFNNGCTNAYVTHTLLALLLFRFGHQTSCQLLHLIL